MPKKPGQTQGEWNFRRPSALTREQRAEIASLYFAGYPLNEVAHRYGVTRGVISGIWAAERKRRGVEARGRSKVQFRAVSPRLTDTEFAYFAKQAERRGLTPGALIREVLAKVAQDKIVDAVIDDGR